MQAVVSPSEVGLTIVSGLINMLTDLRTYLCTKSLALPVDEYCHRVLAIEWNDVRHDNSLSFEYLASKAG